MANEHHLKTSLESLMYPRLIDIMHILVTHQCQFNYNANGVFFDIRDIPGHVIDQMDRYITESREKDERDTNRDEYPPPPKQDAFPWKPFPSQARKQKGVKKIQRFQYVLGPEYDRVFDMLAR